MFGTTGLVTAVVNLNWNIQKIDIAYYLDNDRPDPAPPNPTDPHAGRPLNILVVGSDVRSGENAKLGGRVEGMRSDTTMVLHIAADRSRAEIVSIPRDSIVKIPACRVSDSEWTRPHTGMFNEAFALGGQHGNVGAAAACTWRTVEENTGVRLDDFVVVDFVGMATMVDALGGVPICIPKRIDSPKAHLKLDAGYQTLDGVQALGYARARTGKGLGDGSDIGRIERQKMLMGAMVRQVQSKNLLTDSPALYQFLDAATESLTVSDGLGSITGMYALATSFQNVPAKNIQFFTVPWEPYPEDPNRVVWSAQAKPLWAALATDEPILAENPEPDPSQSAGTPNPTGTPSQGTPSQSGTPAQGSTPSQGNVGTPVVGTSPSPSATPSRGVTADESWNLLTGADRPEDCG